MKLKFVVASLAALGATSAFATVLDPNDPATPPEVTYYISGASAQAQAFNTIAKSLFTTPADVVKITAAAPCADTASENKHVAYYGVRNGLRTLLVYRNAGGSGSGVSQLLANSTSAAAISGTLNASTNAGVVITLPGGAAVAGASGAYTSTSNNCVATLPVAALSDVRPVELDSGVLAVAGTAGYDALSTLKTGTKPTGLQGFGVAVNADLYAALVAANTAAGIPLVNGVQPSIRKEDYASLVSASGGIKSAARLLNNTDTTPLEVQRRTITSGTQAASNIFFLAAGTAGAQNPQTAALSPCPAAVGASCFAEQGSTSGVTNALNVAAGSGKYVIGVVSLENVPAGNWKFVAIDGQSPNLAYDLASLTTVADPYQRQNVANGNYGFAFESVVAYKDPALFTGTGITTEGIVKAIYEEIQKTGNSNLPGFAYEDLGANTWKAWNSGLGYTGNVNKQSKVRRAGGAGVNYAPLVR